MEPGSSSTERSNEPIYLDLGEYQKKRLFEMPMHNVGVCYVYGS